MIINKRHPYSGVWGTGKQGSRNTQSYITSVKKVDFFVSERWSSLAWSWSQEKSLNPDPSKHSQLSLFDSKCSTPLWTCPSAAAATFHSLYLAAGEVHNTLLWAYSSTSCHVSHTQTDSNTVRYAALQLAVGKSTYNLEGLKWKRKYKAEGSFYCCCSQDSLGL